MNKYDSLIEKLQTYINIKKQDILELEAKQSKSEQKDEELTKSIMDNERKIAKLEQIIYVLENYNSVTLLPKIIAGLSMSPSLVTLALYLGNSPMVLAERVLNNSQSAYLTFGFLAVNLLASVSFYYSNAGAGRYQYIKKHYNIEDASKEIASVKSNIYELSHQKVLTEEEIKQFDGTISKLNALISDGQDKISQVVHEKKNALAKTYSQVSLDKELDGLFDKSELTGMSLTREK